MIANPAYGALDNLAIALFVLFTILAIAKYTRGFISNISVLLGIIAGAVVATALGKMSFGKVANAAWFDVVMPFSFGMPIFDPVLIATMVLVMIVTFIESTGMFLALDDLLAVCREFLNPDVSRSGLDRCLRRHGVSNLNALRPKTPAEPHRAFKAYEPGFPHLDVKYLPQMAASPNSRAFSSIASSGRMS